MSRNRSKEIEAEDVMGAVEDKRLRSNSKPVAKDPTALRRKLKRLVRNLLFIYVGGMFLVVGLQEKLIFPGHEKQGRPACALHAGQAAEVVDLPTPSGDKVVAIFGRALEKDGAPAADPENKPTILYFYGNAMCANDALKEFEDFRKLGANVIVADYVGFGQSTGKPSEIGCRDTADAVYDYVRKHKDVDPSRIVAVGWSLGGAVAIDLAARKPLAGLVVFSAFTSQTTLARRAFPVLPVSLLLRHPFDSLSKIGRVKCPILIGHGRNDETIPFRMADQLAAAAKTPVTRLTVESGHNDFFNVGDKDILQALSLFLDRTKR